MEGASGTLAVSGSFAAGLVLICNAIPTLKDRRLILRPDHPVKDSAYSHIAPSAMKMAPLTCTASGQGVPSTGTFLS